MEERKFRLDDVTVTAEINELSQTERKKRLERSSLLTGTEAKNRTTPVQNTSEPEPEIPPSGPVEGT